MLEVLVIGFLIFAAIAAVIAWQHNLSNGEFSVSTKLPRNEVIENFAQAFVRDNWVTEHEGARLVVLKRGPRGDTGCALLLLFLPLGLAYLFTDWGKATLRLELRRIDAGYSEVRMEWRNVGLRSEVTHFANWLREVDNEWMEERTDRLARPRRARDRIGRIRRSRRNDDS